ncbi:hypothetical protein GUJ93_ZPchr0001g30701 [Zizania palustris]|uniref:Uncharacterized protein n=1 Tax=Zizania palustris TaxID=103762 RepID=A0A8J5RMM5_ZIZPA|nr:hypothetical protein GUJ93_ZPchr0001g30701 [Zizania palustris]
MRRLMPPPGYPSIHQCVRARAASRDMERVPFQALDRRKTNPTTPTPATGLSSCVLRRVTVPCCVHAADSRSERMFRGLRDSFAAKRRMRTKR